jgi:hypothetical protein
MINKSPTRNTGWRSLGLALAILLSPPVSSLCEGAPKYKKSTVVDFEGALVEGKSRKPYSAYLTQQRESAFSDLHQWKPDIERSLKQSQIRLDKKL